MASTGWLCSSYRAPSLAPWGSDRGCDPMTTKRPRIEGYAIVSREGMIAKSDGSFPEELKIPADQQFYQDSLERASAVANGRHSAEGGPREKARKRTKVTRRVQRIVHDPDNPNAILWNPATASFDEAW